MSRHVLRPAARAAMRGSEGQKGAIWESTRLAWWKSYEDLYQDAAATTPATADHDPVGHVPDQQNGYNATQGVDASRVYVETQAGDLVNGHRVLRGLGVDYLETTLNPPTSGTIGVVFRYHTEIGHMFIGAMVGASRCYMSVNASGQLAGGIGGDGFHVIHDTVALVDGDVYVAVLTWDGTTVALRKNGSTVYSAAQNGVVPAVPFYLHGYNTGAGASGQTLSDIVEIVVCSAALAGGDLDNYLGNVAFGIPFGAMLLDEAGGALLDESGDVMEAG